MQVIDLIIKLQQLDANMEVLFDLTPHSEYTKFFKFVGVNECEDIITSEGEKVALLSTYGIDDEDLDDDEDEHLN